MVVAGSDRGDAFLTTLEGGDVSVHYVPYTRPSGFGPLKHIGEQINGVNLYGEWVTTTYQLVKSLISSWAPTCLMTSSMPFESHLVGIRIKREFPKVPWIASFSDPWPSWIAPFPYKRKRIPFISGLQKKMIGEVFMRADAVHTPSRVGAELGFISLKPDECRPIVAIPHVGASVAPMARTVDCTGNPGDLVHLGHISRERVTEELFAAIRTLTDEGTSSFRKLVCYGKVCREFQYLVIKYGLEGVIQMPGEVAPDRASEIASTARALLVIEAPMAFSPYLPSKFADYAVAGVPIVAISPERSDIYNFMSTFGGGIVGPHDRKQIARAIASVLSGVSTGERTGGALASCFTPETVGKAYLRLVETAVASAQGGARL
jgi:glycosyltransferase involved in cell wall biosynthesis